MPLHRFPMIRRTVDDPSIEARDVTSATPPALHPHHRVRVVSWNIALGKRLAGVDRLLRGSRNLRTADVVALQEVSRTRRRSQAQELSDRLRMSYVYAGAHRCQLGRERGQAILSPHPILRSWRIVLPRVRHIRIALAADILIGKEILRVVNVHLENRTRLNPFIIRRRAEQLSHVLDWLDAAGHARTLLVGDLNTLGFIIDRGRSEILSSLLESAGFLDAHNGDQTATHRPLRSRLDWIYTRHVTPLAGAVENTGKMSDHLALWADVSLHANPAPVSTTAS